MSHPDLRVNHVVAVLAMREDNSVSNLSYFIECSEYTSSEKYFGTQLSMVWPYWEHLLHLFTFAHCLVNSSQSKQLRQPGEGELYLLDQSSVELYSSIALDH